MSARRSAGPAALVALLALSLASCPAPSGGGGGGGGGTPPAAKNPDTSTWGSWLINGSQEWYLSGSHLVKVDRYAVGAVRWYYAIDKADAASISVIYERAEAIDGAAAPTTAPRDLSFTVSRLGADLMRSPVVSPTTASAVGKYYFLVKSAGASADVAGVAKSGSLSRAVARALVPAAGISLTIANVLNAYDVRTEKTEDDGAFALNDAVPGDQYNLTFPGSGKPPIVLTVGYDGQELGIAADPGSQTWTLKHQGVVGLWSTSSGLRALPYYYAGEEIPGLVTEVRFSGTGGTEWAEWRYSYNGTPFWKSTNPNVAKYDYFELPHESGTTHNTMTTRIPADFVAAADIPAGEDYADREIDLGAWIRSSQTGPYDTRIWQDSLWLRFYGASFQLGTVCDSSSVPKALFILPDQKSFAFDLEFHTFSTDTRVPLMGGDYYLAMTWSGSGTDSYTLGPGVTFPTNASDTEDLGFATVEEPAVSANDSKSTATRIDFGTVFRGTLSATDPVDFLYFRAR